MSQTIISTVGTSLLNNARKGNRSDDSDSLLMTLRSDPQKACAEANALSRLVQEGDDLVFLHSDTEEGKACAEALVRYYSELGHSCRAERIAGLNYNEKGFVSHGLREFVRLLAHEIRVTDKPAHLNATGGFKAEIAYATALGLMLQTPVSYIHEKFGDIVTLPATPIGWNNDLFVWHGEFFKWIDDEPRPTAEVKQRLKALPDTVALLLEDSDDGNTYLSPLGEAYLEAFKGKENPRRPMKLSAEAYKTLKSQDPSTREAFLRVLERLRKGQGDEWQSNTETLSGGVSKFPKDNSALRVFVVEREGTLYVLELSGHREERRYQELMQNIRYSQYEHGEFEDF